MAALVVNSRVTAGADRVDAEGVLDHDTHEQLRTAVASPDLVQPFLVLDLAAVSFIDSLGLAAIVLAHKLALARHAVLVLLAPSAVVVRMLQVTHLDQVLDVRAAWEA